MNGSLRRDLSKLNKVISPLCESSCPDKTKERCCDKTFCDFTDGYLREIGKKYDKPWHLGVPYLSKNGCVVPPEERPLCTCFACPSILKDKKVKKRWDQLQKKIRSILGF